MSLIFRHKQNEAEEKRKLRRQLNLTFAGRESRLDIDEKNWSGSKERNELLKELSSKKFLKETNQNSDIIEIGYVTAKAHIRKIELAPNRCMTFALRRALHLNRCEYFKLLVQLKHLDRQRKIVERQLEQRCKILRNSPLLNGKHLVELKLNQN
ncbi:hypothetical protein SNEBB_007694 [Seison nebaliae]|nr:hypothetical protein SNEBB_007694 [Seison nebaliae]